MSNTCHCVGLFPFPICVQNLIFLLAFRGVFNQGQMIVKIYIHCDKFYYLLVLVTEASTRTSLMYFSTLPSPLTDTSSGATAVIPRENSKNKHWCMEPQGRFLRNAHCQCQKTCHNGILQQCVLTVSGVCEIQTQLKENICFNSQMNLIAFQKGQRNVCCCHF